MSITDISTILGGIAAAIAIPGSLYAFYLWSFKRGQSAVYKDEVRNRKNESFNNVYAPLRVALTNTRFIVYRSAAYPKFKQRLVHAYHEFYDRKYFKAAIKAFASALSDRGESISVECETVFPGSKLKSIIDQYPQFADKVLVEEMHKLEIMDSTPWDHDERDIAMHQYHLLNYIYKRYEELHDEINNN
jgi:hypothetical protein